MKSRALEITTVAALTVNTILATFAKYNGLSSALKMMIESVI